MFKSNCVCVWWTTKTVVENDLKQSLFISMTVDAHSLRVVALGELKNIDAEMNEHMNVMTWSKLEWVERWFSHHKFVMIAGISIIVYLLFRAQKTIFQRANRMNWMLANVIEYCCIANFDAVSKKTSVFGRDYVPALVQWTDGPFKFIETIKKRIQLKE